MGDRFYRQIGESKGLVSVQDIMHYCTQGYRLKRNKSEIETDIGVEGTAKLTKEDMLWLEEHLHNLELPDPSSIKLKRELVNAIVGMYPAINWNILTLKTLKEICLVTNRH